MNQELVTIVPWTFIAQIANLFLQAYLVKKFLFKPIKNILAKRKELSDAELKTAKEAKDEALAMKAEYEQNMKEAHEKANNLIASAQKDAQLQSEEILREANSQAVTIKTQAEKDILMEKKKAVNELKNEIGNIAMEIAGKVIEREISEEDHTKLIDEFINKVGEES